MIHKEHKVRGARVLVLGVTFKENCPDIRNSRVVDIVSELRDFGCKVDVYDPWAESDEVNEEYGFPIVDCRRVEARFVRRGGPRRRAREVQGARRRVAEEAAAASSST